MSESNQNYISRVHFKGYKSLVDLEVDLRPGLNVIIGPNGSGKTNFLEFLYQTRRQYWINGAFYSLIEVNQSIKKKVVFESENELSIENGIRSIYSIRQTENGKEAKIRKWRFFEDLQRFPEEISQSDTRRTLSEIINVPYLLNFGIPIWVDKFLSDAPKFYIDNGTKSFFAFDSSILPYWLRYIFNDGHSVSFEKPLFDQLDLSKLNSALKKCTLIEEIRIETKKALTYFEEKTENLFVENLIFQFSVAGKWLYWNQLSDGTKRLFYIISTVVYYEKYILLEEPELGIHPDQLHKLMDFLKEQSAEKQIILTTHSPEVLNILGADDLNRIIVTRFDRDRGTQMHHLSERQQQKARAYLKETGFLSDFWVHSNLEEYEAEQAEN